MKIKRIILSLIIVLLLVSFVGCTIGRKEPASEAETQTPTADVTQTGSAQTAELTQTNPMGLPEQGELPEDELP